MKNNTWLWCFIFAVCVSNAQTLVDYKLLFSTINSEHPFAKKADAVKELGQRQLQAARGNYDPEVKSTAEGKYFKNTNYYSVFKSEFKQPIFTSQYLKAGYEYGQGLYLNPQYSTSASGLPYVGIEAGLLQGLLFDKRRAEVLKGGFYKEYYKYESQVMLNDLYESAASSYAHWLYSLQLVKLNRYFLQTARDRFGALYGLVEIGEKPGIDTVEAAILLQGRDLELQSALAELTKAENDLRFYFLNANDDLKASAGLQTNDSLSSLFDSGLKMYMAIAQQSVTNNPMLQQYFAKRGLLGTEVRLRRELIKPKLDVSYNFLNGSATNDLLYFGTANYKYGASLSFPLLLRNSRNEHKIAKLQMLNNEFDLMAKQSQLDLKQQALLQSAKIVLQQIVTVNRAVEYSKQLLEAERLKFENGESSLFLLNTRENKLLESELKLADYKIKFLDQLFQIIHLGGSLNYLLE